VDVNDGHLRAVLTEVDVVRDELWLVLVDELGQFADRRFEFPERSVAHL
jgi:hypothetical protein